MYTFGQLIKGIATVLVIASSYIGGVSAQVCTTSGSDLINTIELQITPAALAIVSANPDPGKEAALAAWDAASAATSALCTCNALQTQYRTLSLESFAFQRGASICKYDIFLHLGEPDGPSVGDFQDCIAPVNAGLIATRNAKIAIDNAVRQAPCDVTSPTPDGIAIIQTEISSVTQQIARRLSRRPPSALRRLLKRGARFTFSPQADGGVNVVLNAIKAIRRGDRLIKIVVQVASGDTNAIASLPVEVNLQLLAGGSKHLKDPRTNKLRVTTTFTINDGTAFSAERQFRPKK